MTDTEQLLNTIDKLAELAIENEKLKVQIEELKHNKNVVMDLNQTLSNAMEQDYKRLLAEKDKLIKELEEENKYYHNRCKDCALEISKGKLEDLEAQIEKMKMCCNCAKWRSWKEELDDVSYPCVQHDCDSKCSLWQLKE